MLTGLLLAAVHVVPSLLYSMVSPIGLMMLIVPPSTASKVSGVEVMSCALTAVTMAASAKSETSALFIKVLIITLLFIKSIDCYFTIIFLPFTI